MTGEKVCQFGRCQYPAPRLDPDDLIILNIFAELQTQWHYLMPMGGRPIRTGLDLGAARHIFESWGIPWDDYMVSKLLACESVLVNQDWKRAAAAAKQQPS